MTRSLIYLIMIFALWLYFRFGSFGGTGEKKQTSTQGKDKPNVSVGNNFATDAHGRPIGKAGFGNG